MLKMGSEPVKTLLRARPISFAVKSRVFPKPPHLLCSISRFEIISKRVRKRKPTVPRHLPCQFFMTIQPLKALVTKFRNYWTARKTHSLTYRALDLGFRVYDEHVTKVRISIPNTRRAEHIAILGKTGTGKSSLLRFLVKQDIQAGRGFVCFDLHGDLTSFVLQTVA